ncbi:MAG: HTH domain-containing protein [Candidatus Andersenbacteria bacterium]|nr:HTH domain-containing protein [bacterium]MDZ4225789.1 HTH domain-containing protein [Candidatus Andersenbacteria bacterium]
MNETIKFNEITASLLGVLDARSQDILTRRYGLNSEEKETLESIGREYGITRERVRQLQTQAKKVVIEMKEAYMPVSAVFNEVFSRHGGIMVEYYAVSVLRDSAPSEKPRSNVVSFYLDLLPNFEYVSRDADFVPHWRHNALVNERGREAVACVKDILQKEKHPIGEDELVRKVRQEGLWEESVLPQDHLMAQLSASKLIRKTPFGEWGLEDWPETSPRGVGDKAYAVLRRHGEPEHFTRISEMINEANFDHKRANAQTVHNELIKDDRFVLVGRGLYGLKEWGYVPGTVADVIESLLKEAGKPLSREEVIDRVLAQRQVKKNTIVLGLQNSDRFVRTDDSRYTAKG